MGSEDAAGAGAATSCSATMWRVCRVGVSAREETKTANVASVRCSQYVSRYPPARAVCALSSAPGARLGASARSRRSTNDIAAAGMPARMADCPAASANVATTGRHRPPGSATCRRRTSRILRAARRSQKSSHRYFLVRDVPRVSYIHASPRLS